MPARVKNRPTDFAYDPVFTMSGKRDIARAARAAKMANARVDVVPVFSSMFSDLNHLPRTQLLVRPKSLPVLEMPVDDQAHTIPKKRSIDVVGIDRFRFFYKPSLEPDDLTRIPVLNFDVLAESETKRVIEPKKIKKPTRNFKMQTMYREASAQTSPWQPPYIIAEEGKEEPEVLKLDFLKWGEGLPVGKQEIILIERARMKRAWEKALPPVTNARNLENRRKIIEALERDQWAFREKEIQETHDLRLFLLEKMIEEVQTKTKMRTEMKLNMYCEMRKKQVEEKIKKLKKKGDMALRKLKLERDGHNSRYKKWDIVEEFANVTSELYAPLMRNGEDPKRRHFEVDHTGKKYKAQFEGVENMSVLPRWLDKMKKQKEFKASRTLPGRRLCIRETKWTAPVLKELHEELKCMRTVTKRHCSLRVRIEKEESPLTTPEGEAIADDDEEEYQAMIRLQSMLRGRSSQFLIFEGRDRCRELILELRSTHALQEDEIEQKYKERLEAKFEQRDEEICLRNAKQLQEALDALQGSVVGSLLDFLNKELRRLVDERKSHALCLIAERERNKREAAESGRRQQEILRRAEHDEMFKQIVKVHQDTVDLYLQDIITEGMEFASEEEAALYVKSLAEQMDADMEKSLDTEEDVVEQEEIVANLVHNFLLPEIQKQILRERSVKKQQMRLQTIHEELFGMIENADLIKKESEKKAKRAQKKNIKQRKERHLPPRQLKTITEENAENVAEIKREASKKLGVKKSVVIDAPPSKNSLNEWMQEHQPSGWMDEEVEIKDDRKEENENDEEGVQPEEIREENENDREDRQPEEKREDENKKEDVQPEEKQEEIENDKEDVQPEEKQEEIETDKEDVQPEDKRDDENEEEDAQPEEKQEEIENDREDVQPENKGEEYETDDENVQPEEKHEEDQENEVKNLVMEPEENNEQPYEHLDGSSLGFPEEAID